MACLRMFSFFFVCSLFVIMFLFHSAAPFSSWCVLDRPCIIMKYVYLIPMSIWF